MCRFIQYKYFCGCDAGSNVFSTQHYHCAGVFPTHRCHRFSLHVKPRRTELYSPDSCPHPTYARTTVIALPVRCTLHSKGPKLVDELIMEQWKPEAGEEGGKGPVWLVDEVRMGINWGAWGKRWMDNIESEGKDKQEETPVSPRETNWNAICREKEVRSPRKRNRMVLNRLGGCYPS